MSFKPRPLVFALFLVLLYLCSADSDCDTKVVGWFNKSFNCDKVTPSENAAYKMCRTIAHGIDASEVQKEENIKIMANNWCTKADVVETWKKCMREQTVDPDAFTQNIFNC